MQDLNELAKYYNLGLIEYNNGNFNHALNYFNKAVQMRFEYVPAVQMKALCLFKLGDFQSAAEEATSAVIYEPGSAKAHFIKGFCDYKAGNIYQAINSLKKSLKLDKSNVYNNVLLGVIYSKMNESKKALSELEKAYDKEKSDYISFIYAKLLIETGNNKGLEILKSTSVYPPARFLLAKNIFNSDPAAAEKMFVKLLKTKSYRQQSMYYLGLIYFKKRFFNKAAGLFARLSINTKNKINYFYRAAQAFYLCKEYSSGLEFLDYADKLCGLSKRDVELEAKVLKLKIKTLLKSKTKREDLLVAVKRLEYLSKSGEYSFFIEKSYIRLYKKFHSKSDFKNALYLRKTRGKTLTGTIYSNYSGKLRKWVLISGIIVILILILWEILVLFQK